MSNMPVYRAKKIDSDEYIQGYLLGMWGEYFISWGETNGVPNKVKIDPTTLAIHFEDMLDSEGTRIFASLSKDGKGGDELSFHSDLNLFYNMDREVEYNGEVVSTALYRNTYLTFDWSYGWEGREVSFKQTKVISIQK